MKISPSINSTNSLLKVKQPTILLSFAILNITKLQKNHIMNAGIPKPLDFNLLKHFSISISSKISNE